MFVGSSKDGLPVAEAIQSQLDHVADVVLWTQGVFEVSKNTLESLILAVNKVDFAVLVLTPDDVVTSRNKQLHSPRDNVLFELGLFMGRLGRERSFFVFDRSKKLKIPSDLLGITAATYQCADPGDPAKLQAALGAACTSFKALFSKLGRRTRLLAGVHNTENEKLPNLTGEWAGYGPESPYPEERTSTLSIEQYGSIVFAMVRRKTRDGERSFSYEGRFTSGQLVLFFEEKEAPGYIVGTLVLHLSSDLRVLIGRSTYFHHSKNQVISSARLYRRI